LLRTYIHISSLDWPFLALFSKMGNRPIHASLLCFTTDDTNNCGTDNETPSNLLSGDYGTCSPNNHQTTKKVMQVLPIREYQRSPSTATTATAQQHPTESCTSLSSETLGREARTDRDYCERTRHHHHHNETEDHDNDSDDDNDTDDEVREAIQDEIVVVGLVTPPPPPTTSLLRGTAQENLGDHGARYYSRIMCHRAACGHVLDVLDVCVYVTI
jgi:hypothetical protein